ncbi:alkaline shock response membrane anchor protein AmaP [Paenibacillus sp. 481]|uniref:alkaline shock response membrane anchor protein AmaP n=1 Tax=Paenibacillus sp. 481 TaxID=2835869 RepID=UPI001E347E13|nr:alkaline shock response membrane anchor protein AmaP [Paenibacillus sp. 481]UHA72879.1 alkaline shock response membrane anchor protein AmaP [Paenibacillus sp. 481]
MIRVVDRILLFVYSLAVGILSAAVLLIISEVVDTAPFGFRGDIQFLVITACVLFLISLRFFYVSLRRERKSVTSIDQRTEIGDIKVSLETIENVALKAAGRIRGVKDLKARIRTNESGLDITIRAVVDGESSIPNITEEVQRNVKEYVQEITGIPVSYVSVYVANIVQTQTFKARVE